MKPSRALLAALPLALLAGCGGGGGPNPGPGGGGVANLSDIRLVAFLSDGSAVDPTNVFPGETVQFRLSGLDAGGVRQTVSVGGFSTTAPGTVGSITSGGLFTARNPDGGSYTVRTTAGGSTYANTLRVVNPERVLTGRVRLVDGNSAPLVGVRILNAAGAVVASGASTSTGAFRIAAPASAARLTLDFSAPDPNSRFYVRQFAFNGTDYSTAIAGCTAPLPDLSNGVTFALGDVVVYSLSVSSPPPPPDGCGAF